MLQVLLETIRQPEIVSALAVIITAILEAILAYYAKIKIPKQKALPYVEWLLAVILKVELKNVAPKQGTMKMKEVVDIATKELDDEAKNILIKAYGGIGKAAQYAFDTASKTLINKGLERIFRN